MVDTGRIRGMLAGQAPIAWVVVGDSITHGLRHTNGLRSYVEHFQEIIRGDLGRSRDVVVNTGISGDRISDILDDFDHRVARWAPDVVLLMIGTNDCVDAEDRTFVAPTEFREQVLEFVARAQALGAAVVLQTPPPIDIANATTRSRISEFVAVIRAVAAELSLPLVDQYAELLALGREQFPWALLDDPFHPGALGHAAMAVNLAVALGVPPTQGTVQGLRAQVEARF